MSSTRAPLRVAAESRSSPLPPRERDRVRGQRAGGGPPLPSLEVARAYRWEGWFGIEVRSARMDEGVGSHVCRGRPPCLPDISYEGSDPGWNPQLGEAPFSLDTHQADVYTFPSLGKGTGRSPDRREWQYASPGVRVGNRRPDVGRPGAGSFRFMPAPKRKTSRSRSRMRRAHRRRRVVALSVCPRCSQARPPHRVCGHCGYYGELDVLELEEE